MEFMPAHKMIRIQITPFEAEAIHVRSGRDYTEISFDLDGCWPRPEIEISTTVLEAIIEKYHQAKKQDEEKEKKRRQALAVEAKLRENIRKAIEDLDGPASIYTLEDLQAKCPHHFVAQDGGIVPVTGCDGMCTICGKIEWISSP